MIQELTITQEFVLLALDRETNKLKTIFRHDVALYTVMISLIELSLEGKIQFEDDDTVSIIDSTSTGEKYLDRLLEIMASEKPKKIKKWAAYFYSHMLKQREVYKLVVESLVDKGVLEIVNTEILFIVPVKKYVDVTNTRNSIIQKIRAELLEDGKAEEHTIALVLFLNVKKMLNDYFSEFERKSLKEKIEELRKEEIFRAIKIVDRAIQNIDAAIVAMSAATM